MNTNNRVIELLECISSRFPDQDIWQKIIREYKQSGQLEDTAKGSNGKCICCGYRSADENSVLCGECGKLYCSVTSRVVEDYCDCGHLPSSNTIYVYRDKGGDMTFCGDNCIRSHYEKIFGFFMRKSS